MIIILKRDDLPLEHRQQAVQELRLDHIGLAPQVIQDADLIVFVEGTDIKFMKHFPEIKSKNSIDVLIDYIVSSAPVTKEPIPFSVRRFRRSRKS